jgi:hypothetical protein
MFKIKAITLTQNGQLRLWDGMPPKVKMDHVDRSAAHAAGVSCLSDAIVEINGHQLASVLANDLGLKPDYNFECDVWKK